MDHTANSGVVHLIESRVHTTIRGYRGNLLAMKWAIDAGWIPNGDEPGVNGYLQALRDHLAATGRLETDDFLLRFALTVPGTQRGVVPPLKALELNGNGFTDRRKKEAAGQIDRLNEVLSLAKSFLAGLSHDTLQALRKLADIAVAPVEKVSSEWLDQIQRLSPEESGKVAQIALKSLENIAKPVQEFGVDLLESLACFRFEPLGSDICRLLRTNGIFWLPSLYHDAGESEAMALLDLLEEANDTLAINHLLLCVAWTRSTAAVERLSDWSQKPPSWASRLHVTPADYLPSAGWCLDASGERRDLISMNCHRLLPADEAAPNAIRCFVPYRQKCPSCESPTVALFDFTTIQPELPENAPVKIYCCLYCSMFAPTFVRYFLDQSWEWLPFEAANPRTFDFVIKPRKVSLAIDKCPPFASAKVFDLDDATAIGGVPMWLQDAEYPHCPTCGDWMTFLAQHDNSAVQNEGLYYAFFCPTCKVSAVNFQQT